jgi:hypothetical protein
MFLFDQLFVFSPSSNKEASLRLSCSKAHVTFAGRAVEATAVQRRQQADAHPRLAFSPPKLRRRLSVQWSSNLWLPVKYLLCPGRHGHWRTCKGSPGLSCLEPVTGAIEQLFFFIALRLFDTTLELIL